MRSDGSGRTPNNGAEADKVRDGVCFRVTFITVVGLALLLGAVHSKDPLIRLTCRIAGVGVLAALLVAPRLRSDGLAKIRLGVLLTMGVSFAGVVVLTGMFGGGALNGQVTATGEHYLQQHGHETLVSSSAYYLVATVETLMFVSWPVGFVLFALLKPRRDPAGPEDEAGSGIGGGRPTRS